MKIRLIGFALLTGLNGYVTYQLWDALWISKLPSCFLVLSYLCGVLFLINIKAKTQRILAYTFTVTIFIFGLIYALYFRRPLGFYTAFLSATLFAKNFIAGPNRKDKMHNSFSEGEGWVIGDRSGEQRPSDAPNLIAELITREILRT